MWLLLLLLLLLQSEFSLLSENEVRRRSDQTDQSLISHRTLSKERLTHTCESLELAHLDSFMHIDTSALFDVHSNFYDDLSMVKIIWT
jgi:hypothetical protein